MFSQSKLAKGLRLIRKIRKYSKNSLHLIYQIIKNSKTYRIELKNNVIINLDDRFVTYILFELLDSNWEIRECEQDICTICRDICLKIRTINGKSDIVEIYEIWILREYGESFKGVVIDIGASNGDSSIYFATHGAEKVIALEPYPISYELAKRNIEINNLKGKIELMDYALSPKDGEIELAISTSNPNANSFDPQYSVIQRGIRFDGKIKVKSISLSTLFKQYNLKRVSLLKMDCEGCEYAVLRDLPADILNKIDNIILEFHDYPKDLPDILRKAGFIVDYEDKPIGILKAYKNDKLT